MGLPLAMDVHRYMLLIADCLASPCGKPLRKCRSCAGITHHRRGSCVVCAASQLSGLCIVWERRSVAYRAECASSVPESYMSGYCSSQRSSALAAILYQASCQIFFSDVCSVPVCQAGTRLSVPPRDEAEPKNTRGAASFLLRILSNRCRIKL